MAFKGTAGKSSSGASMAKYDVEVEARLRKLEAQAHEKCDTPSPVVGGSAFDKVNAVDEKFNNVSDLEGRLSALEAKVNKDPGSDLSSSDKLDLLIELLGQNDIFVSRVPKKYKGFFGA